jgi:hypothetical protein
MLLTNRLMAIALCLISVMSVGCHRPTSVAPPKLHEHRFAVDVTLTRNNLRWEHFTPKDYYNPDGSGRCDVYIIGKYNKAGVSPGFYGWLRGTFADSAGNFDYGPGNVFYEAIRLDSIDCPSFIEGGDTLATAFVGSADHINELGGGPGSGYSIHISLAAGVPDAVSNTLCTADTAVAPDDTVYISEIVFKAYLTHIGSVY